MEESLVAETFIRTLKNKVYNLKKCILINKMIVNKYNNMYILEQSKWSVLMLWQVHILIMVLRVMTKILNLKLVIM